MPVGANKPGKHSVIRPKVSKENGEYKKMDESQLDSPTKLTSPAAAKPSKPKKEKTKDGLTADEVFRELRIKVKQAGGSDLKSKGWTCKLVPSPKEEGAEDKKPDLVACFVDPDSGKEFFKRKHVLKHLGLTEPKRVSREEAALEAREKFKELNQAHPLPRKIGEVTVLQWGKVVPERLNFHSASRILPIGFKSSWTDESDKDVLYESEIRDGKVESGAPDGLKDMDGPVFVVSVLRQGQDKQEFFGKHAKLAWRQATKDDTTKDHSGLRDEEVCKHLEGLKHAVSCKNYEFIATRLPNVELDEDGKSAQKKKKTSQENKTADGEKVAGKKRKKETEPKEKSESQKAKRAREKQERDAIKAREKEEKERAAQVAAEEKRKIKEEEARKRKEERALQEIEHKWNNRFPLEDLALDLEERAMQEAKNAQHEVNAQRLAARVVIEAVERGWGEVAVLEAAKKAAQCLSAGDDEQDAREQGLEKGEEEHAAHPCTSDLPMDVEDDCQLDKELICRVGTRIKMLFKVENERGEAEHKKFDGFVSKFSEDDSKNMSIHFYDENDVMEVPKNDPDVTILGQGLLRLPKAWPMPQRAPVHSEDVLTVARFVDAFKAELKLPKCTLLELQSALQDPSHSDVLCRLYQAVLVGAMEAAKDANPNAVVPEVWHGDDTLTNFTWPEIARRWITCGPHAEMNKKRFPEAVSAATCLSTAPGGAKAVPEAHLKLLLCLIEDCMDHADVQSAVSKRVDVADEAVKARDEKMRESVKEEKVAQERITNARHKVELADAGFHGDDPEPMPNEDTKKAIEMAKAEAEKDKQEEGQGASETEEAKALRTAFEDQHAEWKKRRDDRDGKAADKELNDALRQEKRILDQRAKSEADCGTKLEKFCLRNPPLGMDRYRNKYWWFQSNPAVVYVEPPMPPTGQSPPDPADFSLEWRMLCGAEQITKLAECLCEKGVREAELKAGLLKIVKNWDPEMQAKSSVQDTWNIAPLDDFKFYETFQATQQEAKNIYELVLLSPDQQKALSKELPDFETILETPQDCDQMAKLLLAMEKVVHESLAQSKLAKKSSAVKTEDTSEAVGSILDGPDVDKAVVPEEWRNEHEYVGKRVRRNVVGDDGTHAGKANGTIVGYIPKEKADFKSKQTGQDAALWRLRFDDHDTMTGEDGIGSAFEDLEEYEVQHAIQEFAKMQESIKDAVSLKSAASLRGGIAPTRGENAESSAVVNLFDCDEGIIDMAEASNKIPPNTLWTSAMQRDAWRREVTMAASANSVVRVCYQAAVVCENVLRAKGKNRNDLSSAPRRTRTERKRPREVVDLNLSALTGFTESGRRVKKVNYAENQHLGDFSDSD